MKKVLLAMWMAGLVSTETLAGDEKLPKKPGSKDKVVSKVMEHLPIKQAKNNSEFRVDEGHWVYLTAQISQVGESARIDGEVSGINRTVFCGFHAAGIITLYDARDNIIYRNVLPKIGLNGTWLGGSSGAVTFAIDLPKEIADKVRRFELKGYQANHPNFKEAAVEIGEELKKFIGK